MFKEYSKNGGETSSFGPSPVLAREVERPQSLRHGVGIILVSVTGFLQGKSLLGPSSWRYHSYGRCDESLFSISLVQRDFRRVRREGLSAISSALRYHWYPDLSLNIRERAGLYARLITAYHIETAGRRITRPH